MTDIHRHDPEITGVKGLVFIGDSLLVYRRDTRTTVFPLKLDLPGGGSEAGETPFETFRRELQEEFGLKVSPDDITYGQKYHVGSTPSRGIGCLLATHLPASAAADIAFGNEGLEYMLMPLEAFVKHPEAVPIFIAPIQGYLAWLAHHPKS